LPRSRTSFTTGLRPVVNFDSLREIIPLKRDCQNSTTGLDFQRGKI